MSASYFPRNDAELLLWLTNFQTALPVQAKALAVPDPEVAGSLARAKELVSAIHADEQKHAEWQAAVAKTATLRVEILPVIQRTIDRLRATPGYNDEHAKALQAVASRSQRVALDDHQPQPRGSLTGGVVRIQWTRGPLDGVNVYAKKPGESAWTLLARDNRPPFVDPRAVTALEVREYRLVGVVDDQEVGQPSDTLSIAVHP